MEEFLYRQRIKIVHDTTDKFIEGASQAIRSQVGFTDFDPENDYNVDSMVDLAHLCLMRNGIHIPRTENGYKLKVLSRAFQTSDFSALLADVLQKSIVNGWESILDDITYTRWVKEITVPSFNELKAIGLSPFSPLEKVNEGGEIKEEPGLVDTDETIKLDTWGKIYNVSKRALINDDLNVLTRIPAAMAASARKTINDQVYQLLISNPAMSDMVNLFHNTHSNLTSGAMSVATLDSMRKMVASQVYNGQALNLKADTIICPVNLEGTANVIASATSIGNHPNTLMGVFKNIVADSILDASDDNAFYVFASRVPSIVVATLVNHSVPIVDTKSKWSADELSFRIRHDWEIAVIEHRSICKSSG